MAPREPAGQPSSCGPQLLGPQDPGPRGGPGSSPTCFQRSARCYRRCWGPRRAPDGAPGAGPGRHASVLDRIARARARARAHAWTLIEATPAGFPWLEIAGKTLAGWVIIDMDATLVTAHSAKEGAAPTWKMGYGFHPLAGWCRNTRECLDMLLRAGNASSAPSPTTWKCWPPRSGRSRRFRRKILIRVDGAEPARPDQAPAVPVVPAADPAIHLRMDDHQGRRAGNRAPPADAWKPGIARTAPRNRTRTSRRSPA